MRRQSDFRVNEWIMDSGAFSQLHRFGKFTCSTEQYAAVIHRFSSCGQLVAAVCQDWMCEPFIIAKTGLSVGEHQARTVQSYADLLALSSVPIMPVLQGFEPEDYIACLRLYGDLLPPGALVGVGSVCKRNGNPDAIEDVLLAIKCERSDLELHGFGLKLHALERATIRALLTSSDSMAWSYHGRRHCGDSHDPRQALRYAATVQELINKPVFVQEQLFSWFRSK